MLENLFVVLLETLRVSWHFALGPVNCDVALDATRVWVWACDIWQKGNGVKSGEKE